MTPALSTLLDAWVTAGGRPHHIASLAAMRTLAALPPDAFDTALLDAHARGLLYALPVARATPAERAGGVVAGGATLTHAMCGDGRPTKPHHVHASPGASYQ